MRDPQPEHLLGQRIHPGGIHDGEQGLDLLARDAHTAPIAFKQWKHFEFDNPPEPLVERMAVAFSPEPEAIVREAEATYWR